MSVTSRGSTARLPRFSRSTRLKRSSAVHASPAFTLIELLVVISIIALLIGITVPALGQARKQGQATVCLSNVRMIATAAQMYAQDQPRGLFVTFGGAGKDRKVLLLPYTSSGKSNADTSINQIWHCPRILQVELEAAYGFNTNLNNAPVSNILSPSQTVALGDAGINDLGSPILSTHMMAPSKPTSAGVGRPNPRHFERVNVGFVDGHAAPHSRDLPFYPPQPFPWAGVNITDPLDPDYRDQWWDLF